VAIAWLESKIPKSKGEKELRGLKHRKKIEH
jgi:hypothetical protein